MLKTLPLFVLAVACAHAQSIAPDNLQLVGLKAEMTEYNGKKALHLTQDPPLAGDTAQTYAVIKGTDVGAGTIEVEVAGKPAQGAGEGARGFIGLAFRLQDGGKRFEHIYIRPTNGRAEDQVRRNHSVQYASHPDYPWPRMRKEFPEKYETYVDLQPGVWTKLRITLKGTQARLYVHGAEQPTLIVNDLKLGDVTGPVALWIGPGTDGYFANLRITK